MQSFQLHERATTVPVNSYERGDWQKGYESLPQELDYWIDDIEGQIPPELHGTLFRNGSGLRQSLLHLVTKLLDKIAKARGLYPWQRGKKSLAPLLLCPFWPLKHQTVIKELSDAVLFCNKIFISLNTVFVLIGSL